MTRPATPRPTARAGRGRATRVFACTVLGALAWLTAGCAPAEEGSRLARVTESLTATQFTQPYDLPIVTLTDQDGEPFELRAKAAGKVTLLYFGYTSCPDVCPITMARVGRALSLLEPEERARVLPVFITLDAHRDSPEQVRQWVSALHPDIVGLTGAQDELDDAVHQLGFLFPEMERPEEGFYEVAHPAALFVFTPELLGRFGYPHGEATPEQIAADIRALLAFDWGGPASAVTAPDTSTPRPEKPFALDPLGQDRLSIYVTLVHEGGGPDTLIGISSPDAAEGSLHRMIAEDGVMRMRPVEGIAIEGGDTVRLAPGGLHAMLEGLARPVVAGDTLDVTLLFARRAPVALRVPVRHPADVDPR